MLGFRFLLLVVLLSCTTALAQDFTVDEPIKLIEPRESIVEFKQVTNRTRTSHWDLGMTIGSNSKFGDRGGIHSNMQFDFTYYFNKYIGVYVSYSVIKPIDDFFAAMLGGNGNGGDIDVFSYGLSLRYPISTNTEVYILSGAARVMGNYLDGYDDEDVHKSEPYSLSFDYSTGLIVETGVKFLENTKGVYLKLAIRYLAASSETPDGKHLNLNNVAIMWLGFGAKF